MSTTPIDHRRRFKDSFVAALARAESPVNESGLYDFLRFDIDPHTEPHRLAAIALEYFCLEDGAWNGFEAGLAGIILFLTRATGNAGTRQTLEDLKAVLMKTPVSVSALESWAKGAHPL